MIINKEEQIKEICKLICATCAQFDGCAINCKAHKNTAEILYKAGYRKVPDGAVILTPEERDEKLKACNKKQAEIEILKIQNKNLEIAFDRLNARSERLATDNEALQMWNNASAETIQKLSETNRLFESNMKSVLEIEKKNAIKKFAEKLKEKFGEYEVWHYNGNEEGWHDLKQEIDECVKEFTE